MLPSALPLSPNHAGRCEAQIEPLLGVSILCKFSPRLKQAPDSASHLLANSIDVRIGGRQQRNELHGSVPAHIEDPIGHDGMIMNI